MRTAHGNMIAELGPLEMKRLTGRESFHDGKTCQGFDILGFWQWAASDLVSNANRGILAEYLVAQALGIAKGSVREGWAPYDLETTDGTRIEVKSAAYIQSWHQDKPSAITFGVRKTFGWDKHTNKVDGMKRRQADVYVFALLKHRDQETLDPLDVSQWEFFVLPTFVLDERQRSQHSITLASLRKLTTPAAFADLANAVTVAAGNQRAHLPLDEPES